MQTERYYKCLGQEQSIVLCVYKTSIVKVIWLICQGFPFKIIFILHLVSTESFMCLLKKAQNFSNLIALQQSVQVQDNWIPLLNSYISPNWIRLKKSISLNWKITVNVFKQNRTGYFFPYELESFINETHF